MATHLDLEEQEQLDQLKAFWKQYGNLITWALTIVLAGFAAWNGWNWWQRKAGREGGGDVRRTAKAADAGDAANRRHLQRPEGALRRHRLRPAGRPAHARVQFDKGAPDAAAAALNWVADNAAETEYRSVARPAPGRPAGRPEEVRRGAQAARRRERQRSSRRWWPIAAATSLAAQGKTEDAKAATRRPGTRWTRPSSTAG